MAFIYLSSSPHLFPMEEKLKKIGMPYSKISVDDYVMYYPVDATKIFK